MPEWLRAGAASLELQLVAWRRHLHQHPELSFQERETSAFIEARLREWGIPVTRTKGTGLVGLIEGGSSGRTVAVRADIDALPIEEENTFEFRSSRPGVMHACGHDGHTSILLGLSKILSEHRDQIPGRVKLLFQSAEELPPGGALELINEGHLDDVDRVIGLHLISDIPVGKAGITDGPMMANADAFTAVIRGKGGHGAAPQQAVDAIVVASQAVLNWQTIVSRRVDPLNPAVLTVGTFKAGFTFNVIAPEATLTGTVRTFDPETRDLMEREMLLVLEQTCGMAGATFDFRYERGYPAVVNTPEVNRVFEMAVREVLGADAPYAQKPVMGGEDFAYYLQKKPGAFLFLGAGSEASGATFPHHHPRFTIDESALRPGVEILGRTALKLLTA